MSMYYASMYGDPRQYHVEADKDGFYLVNEEYGEEAEPDGRRYASKAEAVARQHWLVDNDEPLDPPGWEGGFAANH